MKPIGKILKDARIKKHYSLSFLGQKTKIKKEFIQAIEKGNWKELPEFPVISGFVKNLASYLKLDTKMAVALLKRDYPLEVLTIIPKPDIENKFYWTPKYTFLVGICVTMIAIGSYLGFQYYKFLSPPRLEVIEPKDNSVVTDREVLVYGKTDPDTVVKINNQPILVNENGGFTAKIEIFEGSVEIRVVATARSGKETTVSRKIIPELK